MAVLSFLAFALSFLGILSAVQAIPYTLYEDFSGATFLDNFNFVTEDPSGGWVTYVDQAAAQANGYAVANSGGVYIGVDHTSVLTTAAGRESVRIEGKNQYQNGLFIADIQHMPTGCGTWPAL